MDLVQILGRNVRLRRRELGLSQEELAFEADMKRSYLSDLERGVRNPTVRALGRLATALKVQPGDLLQDLPDEREASPAGASPP
jgi:transcriptional regulator with XRE-family HTH domain